MNEKMKVSSIVAMGKNRVIGIDNKMMWHVPSEFEHYRSLLGGHYFAIGRKNFEGSEDKLDSRKALVLTRNPHFECSAEVFHDPKEVIKFAREQGERELFILGGEEIYRLFMPLIDTLYLSILDFEEEGDSYFPEHENFDWETVRTFKKEKDADTPIEWEFFELRKANAT